MSENRIRVCAVITEATISSARAAIKQAASVADMIEVRLDYLRDFDFDDPEGLSALLKDKPLPAIITCRAASEGGQQQIDDRIRLRLLVEGARRFADYYDIEASHYEEAARLSPDLSRLIVSYHNFDETPADLDAIYDRVTALPAAVHKIVTLAKSVTDSLAIFKLLARSRTEGRDLIAMAMGEPGLVTRVLGPAFGSFLTYGTLGRGKESAPGQPSCDELINAYRVHRISRSTSITGIIGSRVAHSASPAMHNRAFADLDLDFVYLPFQVEDLAEFFHRFVRPATRELDWNLRGLSVTSPYKTAVMRLLDEMDETVLKVGAVNTVVVQSGRLAGHNTDVHGVIPPLERVCALEGKSCGVIGAGGVARAVVFGLIERGANISVFARDPEKARSLGETFGISVLPLDALGSSDIEVVINATNAGEKGSDEELSPIPRQALRGRRIAYDLVYNPIETQFLKDARAEGCQTIIGAEMLVAQGSLQFELWAAKLPPVDLLRAAALEWLSTDQPSHG